MNPVKRFVTTRIVPALIVAVAALFAWVGAQDLRSAHESATWPSVDGRVVDAAVVEERDASGPRSGGGGGTVPATVTYRARVAYAYTVGGTAHTGRRVAVGEYATGVRADAEGIVARYPRGAAVRVYYRPERPDEAVLEPGTAGAPWFYLTLGLVFMAVGVLLAVVAPRLVPRSA